jgi:hypothetical protein
MQFTEACTPLDIFNVGLETLTDLLSKDLERAANADLKQRAVDALGLLDTVVVGEIPAKALRGIVALTSECEGDRYVNATIDITRCLVAIDEAAPSTAAKEVA